MPTSVVGAGEAGCSWQPYTITRSEEGSQDFPDRGGWSCAGEFKPGAAHIPASLSLNEIKLLKVFCKLQSIVQTLIAVIIPFELSKKPHYLLGVSERWWQASIVPHAYLGESKGAINRQEVSSKLSESVTKTV